MKDIGKAVVLAANKVKRELPNGGGGTGSSTSLPTPTPEDEGKFLRVINGSVSFATIINAEEVEY